MKPIYLLIPAALLPIVPTAHAATLTGLWEFNDSANIGKATVGADLTIQGTAPSHSSSLSDGATSLNGVVTTVVGPANYLIANHGILANGGGSLVNEWTIVFDILSPVASRSSWRTLFQTSTANSNDGDYFIRDNNNTMGTSALGYSSAQLDEAVWNRVVITFNLGTANAEDEIKTYVNGTLFRTSIDQPLEGRYSLDPSILLFADNDGENASLNVGTVAMFDGALSASEVSALGGSLQSVPEPSAALVAGLGVIATAFRRARGRRA
ncbi:PEP-CTERM sorting domain-containing protein [Luteolibacter yonseiensis]|uniref:PEP-CTERM sorting domain-containing protein n=1 Tax=Luteolibacter yonseiensis TaxID=1144680 RepID=A0A934V8K4_9BACT|nr:LamG-like jellyroll fold domain-containing protein [Luteolibacter yonseiensis]MBK1814208.1 PEP-CTERM sorting domain-containing protein [Luteolibacter yonseiensis]